MAGEAKVTFTQFDNVYRGCLRRQAAGRRANSRRQDHVPRGRTALLDAIGRTLNEQGARIAAEPGRPRDRMHPHRRRGKRERRIRR